jgi:2,3-bisphosphoglycerate-independent phosphoglycerate mutase
MRYAVVILDGAADVAIDELGGQTCLEAAKTPELDALAADGSVGLAKNTPDGMEPSSNIACTSICGYDPALYPIGRGALEGAALGIELAAGQVALRTNLCNVTPEGVMHSYSTDNISTEAAAPLYAELAAALDDETFKLYAGTGFRGILVVSGHPELLECEFPAAHNMSDQMVADYAASGPAAALALIAGYEARAKAVLDASAANRARAAAGQMAATELLAFWPGAKPDGMPPFGRQYGRRAAMISGVDLLAGIAGLCGIDVVKVAGVTDGPDNDYAAQGAAAVAALDDHDVVIVHVEAPDAEGHDGNATGKVAAIEAIDREIVARLRASAWAAQGALRLAALPDHPTPAATKRHAPGCVPFLLSGPGLPANAGTRLTEAEGAATGLILDPGFQLMGKLLAE